MATDDVLQGELDHNAIVYRPKPNGHAREPLPDPVEAMGLIEFLALKIPPREMMLAPVIQTQGLAMLYAPRGIGKTFVALGIGLAVARGGGLFEWNAPAPREVLFVDGEMPASTMQERLCAMLSDGTPDPGYFRIVSADRRRDGLPDLASEEGQAAIDALAHGGSLLILDNLSSLVRGKENEADGWQSVQDWLLRLRRRQVSVLLVHHAGKNGEQRGTSRREDVLDTIIALKRPSDYVPSQGARFEVHIEKARGVTGDQLDPFEAKMEIRDSGVVWSWQPLDDVNYERVIEATNAKLSVRDIAEELRLSKSQVSRLQQRAVAEGRVAERKRSGGPKPKPSPASFFDGTGDRDED